MEHLTCLSTGDLALFLDTTSMKIITYTPEHIVVQGESIFNWVWDYTKALYCMVGIRGEVT